MSLKIYNTRTLGADEGVSSTSSPSTEVLLLNILLELRVINEYLSHQADTNGPVDVVRTEILSDFL